MTLDFANLSATDTDAPAATKRSNRVEGTPLPGWVAETFESGRGKAITVRADQVASLRSAIRAAGKLVDLGTRISMKDKDGNLLGWFSGEGEAFVIRDTPEGPVRVPGNLNVTVVFSGKVKRQRRTKDEIADTEDYEDYEDSEDSEQE